MRSYWLNFAVAATATAQPSWTWELNAWMGYANDPLILDNNDGSQVQTLIARRIGGAVGGSLSFSNWLGVAMHAPLILNQNQQGCDFWQIVPTAQ